jgi:hypothetical protein
VSQSFSVIPDANNCFATLKGSFGARAAWVCLYGIGSNAFSMEVELRALFIYVIRCDVLSTAGALIGVPGARPDA